MGKSLTGICRAPDLVPSTEKEENKYVQTLQICPIKQTAFLQAKCPQPALLLAFPGLADLGGHHRNCSVKNTFVPHMWSRSRYVTGADALRGLELGSHHVRISVGKHIREHSAAQVLERLSRSTAALLAPCGKSMPTCPEADPALHSGKQRLDPHVYVCRHTHSHSRNV